MHGMAVWARSAPPQHVKRQPQSAGTHACLRSRVQRCAHACCTHACVRSCICLHDAARRGACAPVMALTRSARSSLSVAITSSALHAMHAMGQGMGRVGMARARTWQGCMHACAARAGTHRAGCDEGPAPTGPGAVKGSYIKVLSACVPLCREAVGSTGLLLHTCRPTRASQPCPYPPPTSHPPTQALPTHPTHPSSLSSATASLRRTTLMVLMPRCAASWMTMRPTARCPPPSAAATRPPAPRPRAAGRRRSAG